MKLIMLGALLIFICVTIHAQQELFKITLEPLWQNLNNNHNFGDKWVLIGSINFKKKSNEHVQLSQLQLSWKGKKLDNLFASLYKKEPNKPFLAIEDNLICDGMWNKEAQKLILQFNKQETLHAYDTFYVVLTIPAALEATIAQGSFEIDHAALPQQLKEYIQPPLMLSLNNKAPAIN